MRITSRAGAKSAGLVVVSILAFSACSSAAAPSPTAAPPTQAAGTVSPTQVASELASAMPTTGKPLSLGLVVISTSDATTNITIQTVQDEVKALGWSVSVIDANGSADAANTAIENLVTKKVDGIYVNTFPCTSLGSGLAAATAAGIPVVSGGGGMCPGIAANDDQGGGLATPVINKMIADMGSSGGNVLALTYRAGFICLDRENTLDTLLKSHPEIKVTKQEVVLPGYTQSGSQATTAWLAAHPAGSGSLAVWGCWDGPAEGALSALQQAGRTDVKVYGQNGEAVAIKAVQAGTWTATMWENTPAESKALVDIFSEIIAAGSSWTPKNFAVGGVLVDKDSVAQFIADHPEVVK